MLIRTISLAAGLFLLPLSIGHGEESRLPQACPRYAEFLGVNVSTGEKSQTCIPYEEMIMASETWRAFLWNFERYFSGDGFPVQIELAAQAALGNNAGRAMVHLDAASANALEVFIKTGDRERAKAYLYLITQNRNTLLRRYVSDERFWSEVAKVRPPASLSAVSGHLLEKIGFLRCLIRLDAWTLSVGAVIESARFEMCINDTEE